MKKSPAPKKMTKLNRFVRQTLFINLSAAAVVVALNYIRFGWQDAFAVRNLVSTLVYSNCIGTLCGFVIIGGVPRFFADSVSLRFVKIIVAIFAATLIGIMLGSVLLTAFGFSEWKDFSLPSSDEIVFSLIIAFGFGLSAYFYEVSQVKLGQKELDAERARTLTSEARLASLESRIHPHFLFNTLNSIAALIREDPLTAEKTVEKLSALLRYSLDSNGKSLVTLRQEIEITEKYLEIEKVRFNDRLIYKIDADDRFLNVELPPLSLQTLVENSIKHVASKTSAPTEISISVAENKEHIEIAVRDNGSGFLSVNLKKNHGLDNLNERLQTLFGGRADLQIAENGAGCVRLNLPKQDRT